jgi:hypothetical protein
MLCWIYGKHCIEMAFTDIDWKRVVWWISEIPWEAFYNDALYLHCYE